MKSPPLPSSAGRAAMAELDESALMPTVRPTTPRTTPPHRRSVRVLTAAVDAFINESLSNPGIAGAPYKRATAQLQTTP